VFLSLRSSEQEAAAQPQIDPNSMAKKEAKKERWTLMEGPDEQGFYTAYNQHSKYTHLKGDKRTPLSTERYDDVAPFQEGFAVVQLDGKGFHIKPDGTPAYAKRYDGVAMPFEGGRADVYADGGNVVLIKREDGSVIEEDPSGT
jgi:hypothetical protein